jgi:hypothetical protein
VSTPLNDLKDSILGRKGLSNKNVLYAAVGSVGLILIGMLLVLALM